MDKTRKISYISFMQIICAYAVVSLHVNECFWGFNKDADYWRSANIIECVFYFAVPVFFMITGATLIDFYERYSLKEYFKKRILKVFIPFIIWSMVGLVYNLLTHSIQIEQLDIKYIYNGIFNTSIIGIYWFFIPLFGVYLCIPLFAAVDKNKKVAVFSYLAIAAFFINILGPFVINKLKLEISWPVGIDVASGYLLFVLFGYILRCVDIKLIYRIIIYILGLAGLLMHIVGTKILSYKAGYLDTSYKGYTNLPCVLYSIAIFVLLKQVGISLCKNTNVEKVINGLSKYSFAIYLMHWYVLCIFKRIVNADVTSLVYRLGSPFVIIAIVICITWVIRKLPVVRHIVP